MHVHGEIKAYFLGIFVAAIVFNLSYYVAVVFLEHILQPSESSAQHPPRQLETTINSVEKNLPTKGVVFDPPRNHSTQHSVYSPACLQSDEVGERTHAVELDCRKRLPQAIGIGVEKCGTGALSFFLQSHPFLAHSNPQEIYFWNKNQDKDLDWYQDQMPLSSKYQTTMEKTPSYIFDRSIPKRIKAAMPDTKFIVIIRDPVVRAVSDYLHLLTIAWPEFFTPRVAAPGSEPLCFLNSTFEGSVVRPNGEVNSDNSILVHGAYVLYLRPWLEAFPRKQILVIDGDNFIKNPLPTLQKVETFLGLPKFFNKTSVYYDEQKGFYCKAMPTKVCAGKMKGRPHPPVDDDVIRKLREYYLPYNRELEDMLGRSFSWTNNVD